MFNCFYLPSNACQCPLTSLSIEECNKYEIIFKGKIISVKNCEGKYGEAIFELEELYKGNATKQFKVLFECGIECAQQFNVGDEWVIYSRYKQIDNVLMDWCSRSRKFFKNEKEDFYSVTYGNDYFDEVKFLREKLGNHRLLADPVKTSEGRNIKPSNNQIIIILLASIVFLLIFYWLFNKWFKKQNSKQ
ncbi:MAG: hypothetical protein SFY56_16485 [Bacteroidota bacterium]|nr:hypothetical protein [Bacteroidota bacterium]